MTENDKWNRRVGENNGDTISRQEALDAVHNCTDIYINNLPVMVDKVDACKALAELPAAQPPLEEFEWCTDCKEYDQKAHCCHRFTKVIRRTVEELNVVRCKDCKWFGDIGCAMQIVDDSDRPSENDFCSFAERKK